MSDLQRLIDWADQFASTIEDTVLIERAQSELGIFQQLPVRKHITPCTLCGRDEDTPAPECTCWCHPGSTAQDHANRSNEGETR